MSIAFAVRDYSLVGQEGKLAEINGLASAKWYGCPIGRAELKELMRRSDARAILDTAIWFAALGLSAFGGYFFWGSWKCLPFFIVYGVLYGSASDARWHECGHRTAFKTRWMNEFVYQIASFMILREPAIWRWSHTRHHTDTIIVGRDPEISAPRPPDILGILLNLFALKSGFNAFIKLFQHSMGRLTAEEETFVPESERPGACWVARIYLAIFVAVIVGCLLTKSILPAMFIGLPTFYGAWLRLLLGLTQHAGLDEDVLDHRLNSRTIYMNPVLRFIYWNMNYHVEHHMFPMVPYHALPRLHQAVKNDCPVPYSGLFSTYAEIIPALVRQVKDPRYFVKRSLPADAVPSPLPMGNQYARESSIQ